MADGRSVDVILTEWRMADRALAGVADGPDKVALEARIERLKEEHRLALAAKAEEIDELRAL